MLITILPKEASLMRVDGCTNLWIVIRTWLNTRSTKQSNDCRLSPRDYSLSIHNLLAQIIIPCMFSTIAEDVIYLSHRT